MRGLLPRVMWIGYGCGCWDWLGCPFLVRHTDNLGRAHRTRATPPTAFNCESRGRLRHRMRARSGCLDALVQGREHSLHVGRNRRPRPPQAGGDDRRLAESLVPVGFRAVGRTCSGFAAGLPLGLLHGLRSCLLAWGDVRRRSSSHLGGIPGATCGRRGLWASILAARFARAR
jgi:hypothetical protein